MKNSKLLPSTVVLALLRLLRGVDAHPEDEDVLLDEFGAVGATTVIPRAIRALTGDRMSDRSLTVRRQLEALDALLVDMLREHVRREGERDEDDAVGVVLAGADRRLELAARRITEGSRRVGAHNRLRADRAA